MNVLDPARCSGRAIGILLAGIVIIIDSQRLFGSPNLDQWTAGNLTAAMNFAPLNFYSVTWGGGQFVAVGQIYNQATHTSACLTSPDGVTWTPHDLGIACVLDRVVWGGGQFVAVGWTSLGSPQGLGYILTSPDGANWTVRSTDSTARLYSVAWGD